MKVVEETKAMRGVKVTEGNEGNESQKHGHY
jgi:hypothetical protein